MTAEQRELLDAIQVLVDKAIKNTTKIYGGLITAVNDKTCTVTVNGKSYSNLRWYGSVPQVNYKCQVFVPEGNMSMAFVLS